MIKNPYRFTGPLDLERDQLVCVPREAEVKKVIDRAINWGDYWAIIGPHQIGKTTFLRLLMKHCPFAHFVHFNFEVCPKKEIDFYPWLKDSIMEQLPLAQVTDSSWDRTKDPDVEFLNFLRKFRQKTAGDKQIFFLFDEIELIPHIDKFLHVWRKVHDDRYHDHSLAWFGVIITGTTDFIEESHDEASPFNITQTLFLEDFPREESEKLIINPLKQLGLSIEGKAADKLISELSGHPSLLQECCYRLVEVVSDKKRTIIKENDVADVIKIIFKKSHTFSMLEADIKENEDLRDLLRFVLNGGKERYYLYKKYSILGAGAIIEDTEGFCEFRNVVFKQFFDGFISAKFQHLDREQK